MKYMLIILALILLLYAHTSFGGPLNSELSLNEELEDESDEESEEVSVVGNRYRRAASAPVKLWPNATVYYYYPKEMLNTPMLMNLKKAISLIDENTCVRFVENQKAANKFQFRKYPNDCWASYGAGPNQEIVVSDWCGSMVDLQVRHLMHILGFLPTLARKDRDDYVTLDSSKFKELASHFKYIADKPETGIELQTPYEYGSVLHWSGLSLRSHGFRRSPVHLEWWPSFHIPFTTKDELYQNSVATFKTTFMDFKMINSAYCKDTTGPTTGSCKSAKTLQCANGGYPNPNKCSVCNCPDGFGGGLCEERAPGSGATLEASNDLKYVDVNLSPIPTELNSTFNKANYLISAPKGARIELQITSLDASICNTGCKAGGVEINLQDPSLAGFRVCCSNFVNRKFITTEGKQLVLQVFSRSLPAKLTFTYKIAIPKCEDESWVRGEENQKHLCFKAILFSKLPSTYVNGKSLCNSDFGAFAAPFRGENDRLAIKAAIDKTNYKKSPSRWRGFYIGIRNVAPSRDLPVDFRYEHDSSPIRYTSWSVPNPSRDDWGARGWEQCVIAEVNNNLNWNDALCDNDPLQDHIGIVCAKETKVDSVATPVEQKPAAPAAPVVEVEPAEKPLRVESVQSQVATVNQKCDDDSWIVSKQERHHICFKAVLFSKLPTTYDDGKAMCKFQYDAFAAPFRGETDRMAIQTAINKTNYKNTGNKWLGFFIGIRNIALTNAKPGDFRLELDNSQFNYTTWSATNPDMALKPSGAWEQCVLALVNDNLNWNDGICGLDKDHIGIICAKQAVSYTDGKVVKPFGKKNAAAGAKLNK